MNMPTTVRLATKTDIKQSLSSRCTGDFEPAYDRCGSMLSKKSPRSSCGIETRNDRLARSDLLNRCCASGADLDSILLGGTDKIVFRQHRSNSVIPVMSAARPLFPRKRKSIRDLAMSHKRQDLNIGSPPSRRTSEHGEPRPGGAKAGFQPSGTFPEWRDVRGSIGVGSRALSDAGHRLQWNTMEKSW